MSPLRQSALSLSLLLALVPASVASQAPRDTLDVFFLGNSYVYYNNLADQLADMSVQLESGPVLHTGHHLHGGFSLRRHLEDGHLPAAIEVAGDHDGWDVVVVQEHSRLGVPYTDEDRGSIGSSGPFRSAADEVLSMVRELGAEPMLYMTWGKEAFPAQIAALAGAYESVGLGAEAPIAPVGLAWDRVRNERPDLDLFDPDGSHPSPLGTYLNACVLYATLTGHSPEGAPSTLRGVEMETPGVVVSEDRIVLVDLDAETAEYLQRVAAEVVEGYRPR